MDLFPELSTEGIADIISQLMEFNDFILQRQIRASVLALDCREKNEFEVNQNIVSCAVSMSEQLLSTVVYEDEGQLNKWRASQPAFQATMATLPNLYHESGKSIVPHRFDETNPMSCYLHSLHHPDEWICKFILCLKSRNQFGISNNLVSKVLKRNVSDYLCSPVHYLHSTTNKKLDKQEIIGLLNFVTEHPKKVQSGPVPLLPPRSTSAGSFIAFVYSTVLPKSLRADNCGIWNNADGRSKNDKFPVSIDGIGKFVAVQKGVDHEYSVDNFYYSAHPYVSRLGKQMITLTDTMTGEVIAPHIVLWYWKEDGDDYPIAQPHGNSKTNKRPYRQTDKAASAMAFDVFRNKKASHEQALRMISEKNLYISTRALRAQRSKAAPNGIERERGLVSTDMWAFVRDFIVSDDFVHKRFITDIDAQEAAPTFVCLHKQMCSIAARSQLSLNDLVARKNIVNKALKKQNIDIFPNCDPDKCDNSGVFVKKSGLWFIDSTYDFTDFYVTTIAFETHQFLSQCSKKRVVLPMAFILHRKRSEEIMKQSFKELGVLIDKLGYMKNKYAAVFMSDADPTLKQLKEQVPFFSKASHAMCDFHFLKNMKKNRKKILEEKDIPINCSLATVLFGYSINEDIDDKHNVTLFNGGALWCFNFEQMYSKVIDQHDAMETGQLKYFERNKKKLWNSHSATVRLMAGRLVMYFTNNSMENLNKSLHAASPEKVVGPTFMKKITCWFHEFFCTVKDAVDGRDVRFCLQKPTGVKVDDLDDKEVTALYKQFGIIEPKKDQNFVNPIPDIFIDALAPKSRSKFISDISGKYAVFPGTDGTILAQLRKGGGAVTLSMKNNAVTCDECQTGKICEHVIIALANLPQCYNRQNVIDATQLSFFNMQKRFLNSKRKQDGAKKQRREFTKKSSYNHVRPKLNIDRLPGAVRTNDQSMLTNDEMSSFIGERAHNYSMSMVDSYFDAPKRHNFSSITEEDNDSSRLSSDEEIQKAKNTAKNKTVKKTNCYKRRQETQKRMKQKEKAGGSRAAIRQGTSWN